MMYGVSKNSSVFICMHNATFVFCCFPMIKQISSLCTSCLIVEKIRGTKGDSRPGLLWFEQVKTDSMNPQLLETRQNGKLLVNQVFFPFSVIICRIVWIHPLALRQYQSQLILNVHGYCSNGPQNIFQYQQHKVFVAEVARQKQHSLGMSNYIEQMMGPLRLLNYNIRD